MHFMVTRLLLGRYLSSIPSDLKVLIDGAECRACFVHLLGVFDEAASEIL